MQHTYNLPLKPFFLNKSPPEMYVEQINTPQTNLAEVSAATNSFFQIKGNAEFD